MSYGGRERDLSDTIAEGEEGIITPIPTEDKE
jgi:hypothetical protein